LRAEDNPLAEAGAGSAGFGFEVDVEVFAADALPGGEVEEGAGFLFGLQLLGDRAAPIEVDELAVLRADCAFGALWVRVGMAGNAE
jgi:hypothetical protein